MNVNLYHICCGNHEAHFIIKKERNGSITRQDASISAYIDRLLPVQLFVRSNVSYSLHYCNNANCASYRKNLRARSRKTQQSYETCQRERLHNSRNENRVLSQKLERLKSRVQKLT